MTAFAHQMGTKIINDKINVPPAIGEGYVQLISLPNDLQAFVMNFTLNTDMHYEQSQSEHGLYTLRFEDSHVSESFTTQIDGERVEDVRRIHSSVYLAYSIFDLSYFVKKGTAMRCITIQLEKEWLAKYFQMEVYNDIVQQYLSLKTASLDLESLDVDYKKNMSEVIEIDKAHPNHVVAIQNRIMTMVERFFNDLYQKRNLLKYHVKASTDDIENVRKIEHLITKNLSDKPPAITKLSKMAFMSGTKLKQLFKDMYGKPIYQYYQFYRMQKAREMLLTKTHTVKEVASQLGFSSVGSFSSAFKKEFKVLPSKYVL